MRALIARTATLGTKYPSLHHPLRPDRSVQTHLGKVVDLRPQNPRLVVKTTSQVATNSAKTRRLPICFGRRQRHPRHKRYSASIVPISYPYRSGIASVSLRLRTPPALRPHSVRPSFAFGLSTRHFASLLHHPPHPALHSGTSISANRSSVSPSTAHGSANTRRWHATNLSARAPGS